MKATCPYCRYQWFITPEALALALQQSPARGRSFRIACPRCRRMVKLARPKSPPAGPPPSDEANPSPPAETD
jgi:DNA-directed RNA polymerase subunit RPC12/RpoP